MIMSLNTLELIFTILYYTVPLAIMIGTVAVVTFVVRKLNSIEKKVDRLEKVISESRDIH
jgi:predicted transcriptional regulator